MNTGLKIPLILAAFSWYGLWFTADQQGQRLMDSKQYNAAASRFADPMRQGVAWYRAGEFEKAERVFAQVGTAEAEYNRGNCLVLLGKYGPAAERFERALEIRPDWKEAKQNLRIAAAREKALEQHGGEQGDQRIGADKIVFDKDKKTGGGQDTELAQDKLMSDESMQAMWLRRVQTKPADFLRSKFAYQFAESDEGAEE